MDIATTMNTAIAETLRVATWAFQACFYVAGALAGVMVIRYLFVKD